MSLNTAPTLFTTPQHLTILNYLAALTVITAYTIDYIGVSCEILSYGS